MRSSVRAVTGVEAGGFSSCGRSLGAEGTILALTRVMAASHRGVVMENEHNTLPQVPVSNWTLATGTRPGERHVYRSDRRGELPLPESRRG